MNRLGTNVGALWVSGLVSVVVGACASAHGPQPRPAWVCVAGDTGGGIETIVFQTSESGDACSYTYFAGPPADPEGGIRGVDSSGDYELLAFLRSAGPCVPGTVPRIGETLAGFSEASGTITALQNGDGIDVTIRATVSFRAAADGTPPSTEEIDVMLSASTIPGCMRPSP